MNLKALLQPQSIAIIGASRKEGSIGYMVVKGIKESGFEGAIYPVNPKADEILGLKVYAKAVDIPGELDMAILTVPVNVALEAAEDAGMKGTKILAVITSGFGEVGRHDLEQQLVDIGHKYKMEIVGPNIVGILNNPAKANASFSPYLPYPGSIALVSQSGALLIALDGMTWISKIGISHMISIGNMADLDMADFVDALNEDPNTSAIALYVEGIKDGRRFLDAVQRSKKPVITIKAGTSKRGELATASHTGSLAGSTKVYAAAFKQFGVTTARHLDDLFVRSIALSMMKPLHGDHIAVISNGGGAGVLATDAAERYGVPLQDPPEDLKELFRHWMPEFGSPRNPVDMTGMAARAHYKGATSDALNHAWTDGVAVLYCETAVTDPQDIAEGIYEAYQEAGATKPVVVCYLGGERAMKASEWLKSKGIPTYDDPDQSMSAMGCLRDYGCYLEGRSAVQFKAFTDVKPEKVRVVFEKVRASGRMALSESEGDEVFQAYRLPVAPFHLAVDAEEAVVAARKIGYPVVVKIASPDILHKTEAKGVKIGLTNAEEVRAATAEVLANGKSYNPKAKVDGVLVQKMAPKGGTEVIFGAIKDSTFQQTLMFGLGGIFVEVLKDVTFRVAPISPAEARAMISEIAAYPIIEGVRGAKPRDVATLAETLSRLSQLIIDFPEIKELDANPVMLYEDGLVIVDSLIKLQ